MFYLISVNSLEKQRRGSFCKYNLRSSYFLWRVNLLEDSKYHDFSTISFESFNVEFRNQASSSIIDREKRIHPGEDNFKTEFSTASERTPCETNFSISRLVSPRYIKHKGEEGEEGGIKPVSLEASEKRARRYLCRPNNSREYTTPLNQNVWRPQILGTWKTRPLSLSFLSSKYSQNTCLCVRHFANPMVSARDAVKMEGVKIQEASAIVERVEIIEILTISRQGRRIILKRFDDFFFIRIILSLLRKIQRNLILLERMKRTNFYY